MGGIIMDMVMLVLFILFMVFVFAGYHKNKSGEREALREEQERQNKEDSKKLS